MTGDGNSTQCPFQEQYPRRRIGTLRFDNISQSLNIEGETKEVANVHAAILKEIVHSGHPLPRPACVISGGETTVTIQGDGLGGRNQEFVLATACGIAGCPDRRGGRYY